MNTPHDHDARDRDAREWAAQENARRRARDAAKGSGAPDSRSGSSREPFPMVERPATAPRDTGEASYRHVAEALRRPPPVDLPPDFAARVAGIAESRAPARDAEAPRLKPLPRSDAFERATVRALVAMFALCALLAGPIYGTRVLQAAAGVQGMQWMALLAGCLALSWVLDWLRRRLGHGAVMPAA